MRRARENGAATVLEGALEAVGRVAKRESGRRRILAAIAAADFR